MRRSQKPTRGREEKLDRLPRQPQVTVVTRIWVVMELMGQAANRMAGQPVTDETVSVPDWVKRGCERLAQIWFRPTFAELKKCGEGRSYRRLGVVNGLHLRFGAFLEKDAPRMAADILDHDLSPEQERAFEAEMGLPEIRARLESQVGRRLETMDETSRAIEQRYEEMVERATAICNAATTKVAAEAASDQTEFISGTRAGHRAMLNEMGQWVGDRGRGSLYTELLLRWPEIEAFKKLQPARSRHQLFEALTLELGPSAHGRDERRFLEVCDDLELKMKGVGRPRKRKPGN